MDLKEDMIYPTWNTEIRVSGGTNAGEDFLSCTDWGLVDLYSENDGSGRQTWVFHAVQKNTFNILVSGGTNEGATFLSCTAAGLVDLYDKDDGSGRQRWTLEKVSPGVYNIVVFGGVDDRKFLSCTAKGKVDLWKEDDGSGRQRWKLTVPVAYVNFYVDQGKIMSITPEVLAEQTLRNSSSVTQSMTFQVSETVTETSTFSNSWGGSLKVGAQIKCGLPFVASKKISTELTVSNTHIWGKTETISKKVTSSFPLVAPPGKTVVCKAFVSEAIMQVPYVFIFGDGTEETGIWEGVSAFGLETEIYEVEEKDEEKEVAATSE